MPSLWELLGASPDGAAMLDARTGEMARNYGRSAFDALTLPAREIAGNFAGAARTNNQEYQAAMQGWRYADPPPGVKVVELDGATYWQTPDGRYAEPQRVNIAGLLPMGQNEQTGAVSMETGRLLPLVQGYMGSEIGTSLSAPKGALGAGAGRVSDKADDGIRLTRADPGIGKPVSVDFFPARGGGKLKHYQEAAKNLGLSLDYDSYTKLKADIDDIAKLRAERQMAQLNNDPLRPGHIQTELASRRLAAEMAAKRASEQAAVDRRLAFLDDVENSGLWRKDFLDRARVDAKYGSGAEIAKANMEAVPRALAKEGWTVRHVSQSKSRRASSRYLISPDGKYEVRLSDHYIPDTPQRIDRAMSGGGPRWSEIVIGPNDHPRDLIAEIKKSFADFLSGD